MGGAVALLAAAWVASFMPGYAAPATEHVYLVDFKPRSDADVFARELCLRFGCTILHVYRYVPGMAIRGGDISGLERAAGVVHVGADLPVTLDSEAPVLIGAPSHGPLAIISGGLDPQKVNVEREWAFTPAAASLAIRQKTTRLVSPLAERMPSRSFWAFNVLASDGQGRLSDLMAAIEQVVSLRYAIGAIYIPLRIHGLASARICMLTDEVLRRGLLVITDIDQACGKAPVN